DDLGVLARLVLHLQHADRPAAHHRAGNQGQRADHEHVGRIAVVAQGMRYVPVIARVVHGGGKEAVDEHGAGLLVDLVLHRLAVERDLDDHVDVVRHRPPRGHPVQNHSAFSIDSGCTASSMPGRPVAAGRCPKGPTGRRDTGNRCNRRIVVGGGENTTPHRAITPAYIAMERFCYNRRAQKSPAFEESTTRGQFLMSFVEYLPVLLGVVGLATAFAIYRMVLRYPGGEGKVADIGAQIHLGAMVFMRREYTYLFMFSVVVGLAILFSDLGWKTAFAF